IWVARSPFTTTRTSSATWEAGLIMVDSGTRVTPRSPDGGAGQPGGTRGAGHHRVRSGKADLNLARVPPGPGQVPISGQPLTFGQHSGTVHLRVRAPDQHPDPLGPEAAWHSPSVSARS